MPRDSAEDYLNQAQEALGRLDPVDIHAFTDVLYTAWKSGNTIYTCGNGGSAGTAQHLAADLFKCTIVPDMQRLRVMSLNENMTLISAMIIDDGCY